jgi:hypothetical protein
LVHIQIQSPSLAHLSHGTFVALDPGNCNCLEHAMTPYTTREAIDLDLVAQRILKLAEIATLEHLEVLLNSQAGTMLEALAESDAA